MTLAAPEEFAMGWVLLLGSLEVGPLVGDWYDEDTALRRQWIS